jgi:hypothetical protein
LEGVEGRDRGVDVTDGIDGAQRRHRDFARGHAGHQGDDHLPVEADGPKIGSRAWPIMPAKE